jgi:hypothetical protein
LILSYRFDYGSNTNTAPTAHHLDSCPSAGAFQVVGHFAEIEDTRGTDRVSEANGPAGGIIQSQPSHCSKRHYFLSSPG